MLHNNNMDNLSFRFSNSVSVSVSSSIENQSATLKKKSKSFKKTTQRHQKTHLASPVPPFSIVSFALMFAIFSVLVILSTKHSLLR